MNKKSDFGKMESTLLSGGEPTYYVVFYLRSAIDIPSTVFSKPCITQLGRIEPSDLLSFI